MAALAGTNMSTEAKLDALRGAARAQHRAFYSSHRDRRGDRCSYRQCAGIGRYSAKHYFIISSPLFAAYRHLIMEHDHLPTIFEFPETAEEDGFAGYGPRVRELYLIMAQQIVQLFRGSKVADIPVQQPTKFALVINLKTAKAMGVTVPEALLVRADKVIVGRRRLGL